MFLFILIKNHEKISPEIMRQVLQEKFQRVKIEILFKYGYFYDLTQTVLKLSLSTIPLVKKKIDEDQQIIVEKIFPKPKTNLFMHRLY